MRECQSEPFVPGLFLHVFADHFRVLAREPKSRYSTKSATPTRQSVNTAKKTNDGFGLVTPPPLRIQSTRNSLLAVTYDLGVSSSHSKCFFSWLS
jgi:hypothetical protein